MATTTSETLSEQQLQQLRISQQQQRVLRQATGAATATSSDHNKGMELNNRE